MDKPTAIVRCKHCGDSVPKGAILGGLCPVGRGGVHEPELDLLGDPVPGKKPVDPVVSAHARALRLGRSPALMPPAPPPPPVEHPNAGGVCPCCKQKVRKLNPHRMDKAKVQMLELLGKHGGWLKVHEGASAMTDKDMVKAPYRARAHVSRLVWFGLAEHGEPRSGLYRITPQGFAFLKGEHMVPDRIYCKDGIVVERSTTLVAIGSVEGVVLDKEYWDNYWKEQK